MPYEGEFAQYRSLRRLAENERVRELLAHFRVQELDTEPVQLNVVSLAEIEHQTTLPRWVLAVDGSHAEIRVENGYPQAETSYVTVASVLLDVEKMQFLDQNRPVNPQEFRKTEHAESVDAALPSCNVVFLGDRSARISLRRALFEVFSTHELSSDCESLLDTYEALLEYKPDSHIQRCPIDDCPMALPFIKNKGKYVCGCSSAQELFSTDALRIHEGMNLEGSNGALFAEVMQVWERVWIVHCLRVFEQKRWLPLVRQMAFVLDGPLAVFGHPAWLSQAIKEELKRINRVSRRINNGQDFLLLGVEKTGSFVQHFDDLDRGALGQGTVIQSQTAVLLDDHYIKSHIVFSQSDKPYGEDTYFGRKLLYKTASGARIVATFPFLEDDHENLATANVEQYPRLGDALNLLDQLVSSRYPNALAPLVSAHAEAAIPLNLGAQVLERLARELMQEIGT